MESQLASTVLMIRPVRFESNRETAASNAFQGRTGASAAEQQQAALGEFDALAAALREHGIEVLVYEDTAEPHTPDSIFPNNWVSFHANGDVGIDISLRVFERLQKEHPRKDPRFRLEHCTVINDDLVSSGHIHQPLVIRTGTCDIIDKIRGGQHLVINNRNNLVTRAPFSLVCQDLEHIRGKFSFPGKKLLIL